MVCRDVAAQVANGEKRIIGVMIESSLVAGSQPLKVGKPLTYGQSVTDPCIGWDETYGLLKELAAAVKTGRSSENEQLLRITQTYLVSGRLGRGLARGHPR